VQGGKSCERREKDGKKYALIVREDEKSFHPPKVYRPKEWIISNQEEIEKHPKNPKKVQKKKTPAGKVNPLREQQYFSPLKGPTDIGWRSHQNGKTVLDKSIE